MIRYVALALAMALAVPSAAEELRWDWGFGSGSPSAHHRGSGRRYHRHRRHSRTKVMAYEKRAKESRDADRNKHAAKCLGRVRGLGTQWIGTQGAMDAAKKDWMERVRYDHGESYIDLTNAQDLESRCGRTSIGEVAGQVTYRCEIVARPCRAPMQEVTKAK